MTIDCYSFDRFKLLPDERRLIDADLGLDVSLVGKCFDLLVALVENHGRLVTREKLINKVWGFGVAIEPGNLSTQISSLRKALGDDGTPPKFISTIRGTGFRFIATVKKEGAETREPTPCHQNVGNASETFEIESHRFVPTYVGVPIHVGTERFTNWGGYRELHFNEARLCITSYGIGVWHIRDVMQFSGLTDLAYWRRDGVRSILRGEHPIGGHTADLKSKERTHTHGILGSSIGRLDYALSAFALKRHGWTSKQLRCALKVTSCPRVLLPSEESKHDQSAARLRELEMLESGFEHLDSREFGVFGTHFGYASWAGVSYYGFGRDTSKFIATLADFEIAVQSVWFFCHLIKEIADKADKGDIAALQLAASTIRNECRRIKAIGPKEPTEVRLMCEAILVTSRIQSHANAALETITALRR
jgi:DNA-binding winged helix-turn-helix (wHTH) protein